MKEYIQKLENVSTRVTEWIGTTGSLVVHTIFFIIALALPFFGLSVDNVLLILTTIVSLEAIYLSIFIQMTVNRHAESLEEVQEDVQEISEDVEEISKDVEEISIDVDEISEDVDKINEEEQKDNIDDERTKVTLEKIEGGLQKLLLDIETLKQQKHDLDVLKQNNQSDH
ncbi:MAG: hypothetical protein AAB362_00185 [Patescibacteria group bacterium]